MNFGITPSGLNIRRLQDVKQYIEEQVSARLGAVDQSSASLIGNYNAVISEIASEIWENLEETYLNFYPNSAENVGLDNAVLFNGLTRLQPSSSRVTTVLIGAEGTLVPATTQLSTTDSNEVFETEVDKTITQSEVVRVEIAIDNIIDTHDYTITIDTIPYTYTSDASATKEEIINGLINELVIAGLNTTYEIVNVSNETILITVIDRITEFSCALSADLSYEQIGSRVDSLSVGKGSIAVPIGTLTNILTPIFGLDTVTNLLEGIPGRETETDTQLRLRREESIQVIGAATLEAIRSRILNEVADISSVRVFENPTDIIDPDLRPPHSIEVVAEGGNDELLAQKIFEVKAAGIQTHGNQSEIVIDSQGIPHDIKFTRPTVKYAHIRYTGTLSTEIPFPPDGTDQIAQNTLDLGETFGIGDNYLIQKFYSAVYAVQGVSTVDIEIAITNLPGDTPVYQTTNISVAFDEILQFANDRIHFVGF